MNEATPEMSGFGPGALTKGDAPRVNLLGLAEGHIGGVMESPREIPVLFWRDPRRDSLYTLVPLIIFQELTGTRLERGKMYSIHFIIKGVGDSWTRHTESGRGTSRRYVTLRLSSGNPVRPQTGRAYFIVIDCVTDTHLQKVAGSPYGPLLSIPKSFIAATVSNDANHPPGDGPVVMEMRVLDLSEPESTVHKCYSTLWPDRPYDSCRLWVGKLGAKAGNVMQILPPKRYVIADFAQSYNGRRPENLANVALEYKEGDLVMIVDTRRIRLLNPVLSTSALRVCLRATLNEAGKSISFWYDGENTKVRFMPNHQVRGMSASDSGLDIVYENPARHPTPSTFRFRIHKFDAARFRDEFRLVSTPEFLGDRYLFEVTPNFRDNVLAEFGGGFGGIEDNYLKGDIAESIQRLLLSMLGQWEEVEYHPFDHSWQTYESKKKGPDSIQQSVATGALSYFELRWSKSLHVDYSATRGQALEDLEKYPTYKQRPVNIAHVGLLVWDPRETTLKFFLRKVTQERVGTKETARPLPVDYAEQSYYA